MLLWMRTKCIISSRAECQFQICGDLEFGKLLFLCIFVGLNLTSEKEQRVMTGLVHTKKDDAIKRRERGAINDGRGVAYDCRTSLVSNTEWGQWFVTRSFIGFWYLRFIKQVEPLYEICNCARVSSEFLLYVSWRWTFYEIDFVSYPFQFPT